MTRGLRQADALEISHNNDVCKEAVLSTEGTGTRYPHIYIYIYMYVWDVQYVLLLCVLKRRKTPRRRRFKEEMEERERLSANSLFLLVVEFSSKLTLDVTR